MQEEKKTFSKEAKRSIMRRFDLTRSQLNNILYGKRPHNYSNKEKEIIYALLAEQEKFEAELEKVTSRLRQYINK